MGSTPTTPTIFIIYNIGFYKYTFIESYMIPKKIYSFSKAEIQSLISESTFSNDILGRMQVTVNGHNATGLKNILKEFNLKVDFSKFRIKYNHDIIENVFKVIDTKEKAYWLGFIASDGYVPADRNRISFELSKKDENQLIKFIY